MQELIAILNKVFKHKEAGAYLDIGAYDGVADNVTNHFYKQGWRGICIEPQTKYFKLGAENRPDDLWIKGVVVGKEHEAKTVSFYEDETGQRSSTWYSSTEMKKKQLKAIKINDDVPRGRFDTGLDLLIIDTGEEFEILQSIDLGLWKPNIVVIPIRDYDANIETILHMQQMGYYHLAENKTGDWLAFSNKLEDNHAL